MKVKGWQISDEYICIQNSKKIQTYFTIKAETTRTGQQIGRKKQSKISFV